jgi:predicted GIY-YIG superfamily endonuclease
VFQKQKYYLYFLRLEDDCYYIGITARANPLVRVNEHFAGHGAVWTKAHHPLQLLSLECIGDLFLYEARQIEQDTTKKFMDIFGHNKVRGGHLTFSGDYVKYKNRYLQACC